MSVFGVQQSVKTARAIRRANRVNIVPVRSRAGRGAAGRAYVDFSVYVWNMGGNPGGRDVQGNIIPTTLKYRIQFINGNPVGARVNSDGEYMENATWTDTASAPMQPHMQLRIPGVEYEPAANRSIADGFQNENGDFILKRVLETPIFTEACP